MLPDFHGYLSDWQRHPGSDPYAQSVYVASELVRIARAGVPVLTAILSSTDAQLAIGIRTLRQAVLQRAGLRPRWRLRLRDGAELHPTLHKDPQGRDLPPAERGSVLVVKVGTAGGSLDQSWTLPDSITSQYGGAATIQMARQGRDVDRVVRVTAEPDDYEMADAMRVLRAYGFGIAVPHYLLRNTARPRDQWLVVELPTCEPAPVAVAPVQPPLAPRQRGPAP